MEKDSYKVSFRIMGEFLEPQNITCLLGGLTPSTSHKKGDENTGVSKKGKKITFSPYASGLWTLDSQLPETSNLEEHLNCLLSILEPFAKQLNQFKTDGLKMNFYCGYFTGNQPGFDLQPHILERIAKLGITLSVSIYCE